MALHAFVADIAVGVLHDNRHDQASCMISQIPPPRQVQFRDPAAAYALGFRPCPTCMPVAEDEARQQTDVTQRRQ